MNANVERSNVEERVVRIIVEQLNLDKEEVKLESSFTDDLGADSLDRVAVPLSEAIASTGVGSPYNVFFVADGSVFVFSGDISDMRKVVIEADLMLELLTAKDLVREAAISLELEECVIE